MIKNPATTNPKAINLRNEMANGYVLLEDYVWDVPCKPCLGKGNVKSSCCAETECGSCHGYGVENLGEKPNEPVQ